MACCNIYKLTWFSMIFYDSAVQPVARGPHAAREGILCGPPSSHTNCSFGLVISQMKSTCKIQQCLMVFWVSKFQKMSEFAVFIEHSEAKSVSASGGLCPPDLQTRGSAPGPRWRLRPQTLLIGLRSARLPWPPLIAARQLVENTKLSLIHISEPTRPY